MWQKRLTTKVHFLARPLFFLSIFTSLFIFQINCQQNDARTWSTFRHDAQRSGVTKARVQPPLSLKWVYHAMHPPKPAWYQPAEELPRMHSDNAFHVAVSPSFVYFGSSADDQIYALDLKTGEVKWSFFTEGPVRYSPTLHRGRIYTGSDDGYVYCLHEKTGRLIWKYRPGPAADRVLGNGRMISRWPVRTSVLVDNGVAYSAAGVFPYEGLYICAVRAKDGKELWKNDTVGDHEQDMSYGGITPQGYALASKSRLYIPSGRAMPAAFDRKTGQFLYVLSPGSKVGGTWALLADDEIIAGVDRSGVPAKVEYDTQTGKRKGDAFASFHGIELTLTQKIAYTVTEEGISAIMRESYTEITQKIDAVKKKQKDVQGRARDLTQKLAMARKSERDDLQKQLTATTDELAQLGKDEERLNDATCKWQFKKNNLYSLILADSVVFVGGEGIVLALDAQTGENLWQAPIEGKALGLAATKGSFIVSTDKGSIYCFSEGKAQRKGDVTTHKISQEGAKASFYKNAAKTILQESGVHKGYCLVLDSGEGHLAEAIARQSNLDVIGIEKDKNKIEISRKRLQESGLYGSRVIIEPWDIDSLPNYFANLIVSDDLVRTGKFKTPVSDVSRVLEPCSGTAFLGQAELQNRKTNEQEIDRLTKGFAGNTSLNIKRVQHNGTWISIMRGKLDGAGAWTNQYGNNENTLCSDDQLVKLPLGVLWWGEPGPEHMVDRHARATAPVAMDGRMFIQGENLVMAYDSYNGTLLWQRQIPGAVRVRVDVDGGNMAVNENGLFVAADDKCLQLDPATGETVRTFHVPPSVDGQPRRWGYVACIGNTLYGSAALPLKQDYNAIWKALVAKDGSWKKEGDLPPQYVGIYEYYIKNNYPVPDKNARAAFQRDGTKWRYITDFPAWSGGIDGPVPATQHLMASDAAFAMDIRTGKLCWIHRGKIIAHITIAIGENKVFFAENNTSAQQKSAALSEKKRLIQKGSWTPSQIRVPASKADIRVVTALDIATGQKIWEKPIDLTGCGGDAVASAYRDGVLLFFGSFGLHDKWRFGKGQLRWHRITALSTKTRNILWSRPLNYMTRPVIIDSTVIIEPRACDLYTGKIKMRRHPVSSEKVPWEFWRPGHTCAITSANRNALFYRSHTTAFYDLQKDAGVSYYGAIRPGCWINMVPANGLLLYPEASSGCTCSFPIRCSIVLESRPERKTGNWNVFVAHGAMTPVKRFAINLGAPGDRKDEQGTEWFAYPRPKVNYGIKFNLDEDVLPGMGYFSGDVRGAKFKKAATPWLFVSGCVGLLKCNLHLIDNVWGEAPGDYTVRLGFAAPESDKSGKRIFNIKLQGEMAEKSFDIFKAAGSSGKAIIKEYPHIPVQNDLLIEFSSGKKTLRLAEAPLINFIEVIREDSVKAAPLAKHARTMSASKARTLLARAKRLLDANNNEKALQLYNQVFDAVSLHSLKMKALHGMAIIGSPSSLGRIAPYCKDTAPILWDYAPPDSQLSAEAIKAHIAIAKNIAETDRAKAIRMLKYDLDLVNQSDLRSSVIGYLKDLGVDTNQQ